MVEAGDKLYIYRLGEKAKITEDEGIVTEVYNDETALVVIDGEPDIVVELELVNDDMQQDMFVMTDSVFPKAREMFEKHIQYKKLIAEDRLRRATETQNRFYRNNTEPRVIKG